MDDTDRELARAILDEGDETAFRALYRRHTPRLLGFVHRLLGGSGAEAEDVVQETWIRACERLDRFRWDSRFSTWLGGIGLNTVRERHARLARAKDVQVEQLPEPAQPALQTGERVDLERSIRMLPDGYRTVLLLHDVEGMKHSEIARRLGISAGTSKSQLSNARRLMRSMLCATAEMGHGR